MKPPKLAEQLLHWSLPEELKEPILGDLEEEFSQKLNSNAGRAMSWYRRQAIKSAWQFIRKTQRGIIMFLVSILVFVLVAVMGMEFGIDSSAYFDIPSVLLVVMPSLFFALAATNWSSVKLGFSLVLNDQKESDEASMQQAKLAYKVMGNIAMLSGAFATVMGIIAIAGNTEPETFLSVIGSATAVCLLTLYYGFALKMVAYVIEQKVEFKMAKNKA